MSVENRIHRLEQNPATELPGGFRTREAMLSAMRAQIEADDLLLASWRRDGRLPPDDVEIVLPAPSGDAKLDEQRARLFEDGKLLERFFSHT